MHQRPDLKPLLGELTKGQDHGLSEEGPSLESNLATMPMDAHPHARPSP